MPDRRLRRQQDGHALHVGHEGRQESGGGHGLRPLLQHARLRVERALSRAGVFSRGASVDAKRCSPGVPYHAERRYEMYALEDIAAGEELTIRYDSTNWREKFTELKGIIGAIEER